MLTIRNGSSITHIQQHGSLSLYGLRHSYPYACTSAAAEVPNFRMAQTPFPLRPAGRRDPAGSGGQWHTTRDRVCTRWLLEAEARHAGCNSMRCSCS